MTAPTATTAPPTSDADPFAPSAWRTPAPTRQSCATPDPWCT